MIEPIAMTLLPDDSDWNDDEEDNEDNDEENH